MHYGKPELTITKAMLAYFDSISRTDINEAFIKQATMVLLTVIDTILSNETGKLDVG